MRLKPASGKSEEVRREWNIRESEGVIVSVVRVKFASSKSKEVEVGVSGSINT